VVGASLEMEYKLVLFAIIVYISGDMNRSNRAKGSEASTLDGILALGLDDPLDQKAQTGPPSLVLLPP